MATFTEPMDLAQRAMVITTMEELMRLKKDIEQSGSVMARFEDGDGAYCVRWGSRTKHMFLTQAEFEKQNLSPRELKAVKEAFTSFVVLKG